MSESPNRYIIAYDIVDDRRRSRVAKHLQRFGLRVQYSVFVVDLRSARLLRLTAELESRIDAGEDSIMVCRLGPSSSIERDAFRWLGRSRPEPPRSAVIV